jgi:hypothetical protein
VLGVQRKDFFRDDVPNFRSELRLADLYVGQRGVLIDSEGVEGIALAFSLRHIGFFREMSRKEVNDSSKLRERIGILGVVRRDARNVETGVSAKKASKVGEDGRDGEREERDGVEVDVGVSAELRGDIEVVFEDRVDFLLEGADIGARWPTVGVHKEGIVPKVGIEGPVLALPSGVGGVAGEEEGIGLEADAGDHEGHGTESSR